MIMTWFGSRLLQKENNNSQNKGFIRTFIYIILYLRVMFKTNITDPQIDLK